MVQSITEETGRDRLVMEASEIVGRLNRKLNGWANYFCLGLVTPVHQAINAHVTRRLRQWLSKKHKVQCTGTRYPNQYLYEPLGLMDIRKRTPNLRELRGKNCAAKEKPRHSGESRNPGIFWGGGGILVRVFGGVRRGQGGAFVVFLIKKRGFACKWVKLYEIMLGWLFGEA
jgi:hypothetical protein